jgi:uncharacterized protein (DUF2235 family)
MLLEWGLPKIFFQCIRFIFENYNAGDKIFLFGFSRGAATVRSLSSFIHYFGVLPKSRSTLIRQAFKLYEDGFQPITQDKETILEEDTRKVIERLTDRGSEIFLILLEFVVLTKMRHDWLKLHHENSQNASKKLYQRKGQHYKPYKAHHAAADDGKVSRDIERSSRLSKMD